MVIIEGRFVSLLTQQEKKNPVRHSFRSSLKHSKPGGFSEVGGKHSYSLRVRSWDFRQKRIKHNAETIVEVYDRRKRIKRHTTS